MVQKIVYFSRDGESKSVAKTLGDQLGAELIEISTKVKWKFFWGFIKAGFYTVTDKDLEINLSGKISENEDIIVVSPVWAGKAAQPTRVFLKNHSNKTHLVLLSAGSGTEGKDVGNIIEKVDIIKKLNNKDQVISELITKLKS